MAILSALLVQSARTDDKNQGNAESSALEEVVVKATKLLDKPTLQHIARTFTRSHATPNPRTGQISHWEITLCPVTRGLPPQYAEYVTHRIVAVAKEAGAPSSAASNCNVNVQILFTREPQKELDRIAKIAPAMLGYPHGSLKELAMVRFPVQAWYVTGTAAVPGTHFVQLDSQFSGAVFGPPSHLEDVVSQIGYELVAVDESKISDYSLDAIADYIAMLVLTRTAQNGCNVFPSIIDLFSPDCASSERPQALTDADKTFLKALYGARFGMTLNIEQNQITQQLVHAFGR
jgi:hypothetical protein